jgi:hypothetical protein
MAKPSLTSKASAEIFFYNTCSIAARQQKTHSGTLRQIRQLWLTGLQTQKLLAHTFSSPHFSWPTDHLHQVVENDCLVIIVGHFILPGLVLK